MKHLCATVVLTSIVSLFSPQGAGAQDKKLDLDKAKNALEKLAGEAKKAIGKAAEGKSDLIWPHSKETLALPKDDYLKKASAAMRAMDAEIKALAEAESPVNSRDYFKTHLESLKQHLAYCRQEADKVTATEGEDDFRVKQKKFDRALGFLAENVQLAKEEAGL